MSTTVGAIVSEPYPMPGQSNRSSFDFQLLAIENDAVTLAIVDNPNLSRIKFNIYRDKSGKDPVVASNVGNGSQIKGLEVGADYYIGNPSNPGGLNFGVIVST